MIWCQHQTLMKVFKKLNERKLSNDNNLDDFTGLFPEFKDFKTKPTQDLNDSEIQFTFDLNKQEFVPSLKLPNKKKIVTHNFEMHLEGDCGKFDGSQKCRLSNNTNGQNGHYFISKIVDPQMTQTFTSNNDFNNCAVLKIKDSNINQQFFCKTCSCNKACSCDGLKLMRPFYMWSSLKSQSIEIVIDNYFNIYIPSLKTYLVFNYVQFPIYTFFINNDKLNLYHNTLHGGKRVIRYNQHCPSDAKEYGEMTTFINNASNYCSSQDKRNQYKTTFFKHVLDFYK